MHIPHPICLSSGPAFLPFSQPARVTLSGHELRIFTSTLAREAVEARDDGWHESVDCLDWLVAALREAALWAARPAVRS